MTNWPHGGYAAGDTPASELKPPPASMVSKQRANLENATYTAAEVKVLTEAALRLGRKEAGEEIAVALEARESTEWALAGVYAGIDAAYIARSIGSRPSGAVSDERSGTTEPQEAP
jgi:hypothetical protein